MRPEQGEVIYINIRYRHFLFSHTTLVKIRQVTDCLPDTQVHVSSFEL